MTRPVRCCCSTRSWRPSKRVPRAWWPRSSLTAASRPRWPPDSRPTPSCPEMWVKAPVNIECQTFKMFVHFVECIHQYSWNVSILMKAGCILHNFLFERSRNFVLCYWPWLRFRGRTPFPILSDRSHILHIEFHSQFHWHFQQGLIWLQHSLQWFEWIFQNVKCQ